MFISKHIISLLTLICFIATSSNAQVKFYAQTDAKEIMADSYVTVSFSLNNAQGTSFTPPDFKGFKIRSGPSQSTQSSNMNGKRSYSQIFSYVLSPTKVGNTTIGRASITVRGKKMQTNPIRVKVVPASKKKKKENDFFITMELSDSIAYPGQQIVVDYKLHFSSDAKVRSIDIRKEDEFDGFFASVISDKNNAAERKIINGTEYVVQSVRKVALFPQTLGEFDIIGANFVLFLPQERQRGFFFNSFKEEHLRTSGSKIIVKPLVRPRDPYFCGAVGHYGCVGYLDKTSISTDQSVTLNLKVIGDGDPKLVSPPELRLPGDLEVYDPNLIKEDQFVDQGKQKHQKIYEYLIVPNKKGRYNITPSITYFDVDSNAYIESPGSTFSINVVPGNTSTLNEETTLAQRSDKLIPFKENIGVSKVGSPFFGSLLFWLLTVGILLGFPILAFGKYRKIQEANIDPAALKYEQARKIAQERLTNASLFMEKKDQRSFYNEIAQSVYGYVSDKLQILPADLSRSNIASKLKEVEVEDDQINKLQEILQSCEMALFAGSNESNKMQITYDSILDILADIENQMK